MFSIADQGAFSGTNFLLNVLLVRWLFPADYGAFSVVYSILIILAGFQSALILEPVAVYGSTRHSSSLPEYLGFMTQVQFIISLFFSLLLLIAGLITSGPTSAPFMGCALGLPLILIFWFYRQACYVETRSDIAAQASGLYAILILAGLITLYYVKALSSLSAFLLLAAGSLVASILPMARLKVKPAYLFGFNRLVPGKEILQESWSYGRWILAASVANTVANSAYVPLIGVFAGLGQAAAFRSMQNLVLPVQQVLAAIYLILLPWVSRQRIQFGIRRLSQVTMQVIGLGISIVVVYSVAVYFIAPLLVQMVYQNPYYNDFVWLFPYLGLAVLIVTPGQIMAISLRSMERSDTVLWAKGISAICILLLGIPAMYYLGLAGVLASLLVSSLVETAVFLFYFLKVIWKPEKGKI